MWISVTSDESYYEDEDGGLPGGERDGFILRVTLKSVRGRVDLVQNYKAVLTFDHGGQRHRALLLTAKYTFPEKATAIERRDLTKVLSKGDPVIFTCHEYDKPNGTDRCGWWVMEAVKMEAERSIGREAGYFQSGHLYEKIGTVKDVLAAEGLLHFVLDSRREVAWFSSQEVFINGRPCEGRLSDALETGQRVHFNAEKSPAPRGADWRCTCVWRGEQPTVEASKKRIEAAVVKKQKKTKSSKSRIDDLDDFELPSVPASAGGDSWSMGAATIHVPQSSPHHTARSHQGGGDRGGRPVKQPSRLRASMVDTLDDFDTGLGGSGSLSGGLSGSLSGSLGGGLGGDGGMDWTLGAGGGGNWADEPDLLAGEEPLPEALGESMSSGPSRPLSDASLEHNLGPPGPIQSPSRAAAAAAAAAARQSPAGRGSPAEVSRPPLLPLLEHSVPLPDPSLPRPPLLSAAPEQLPWPAGGYTRSAESPAASSQARPPPGLSTPLSGPAEPPGLSPSALAAAAAANYKQQQQAAAAASLLGEPPVSRGIGLLPTPPLAMYGYPASQPAYWQSGLMLGNPQMAHQAAAADQQVAAHLQLYGAGLAAPPPPPPTQPPAPPAPAAPVMPPLTVDQESLEQMVKGGRLPVSAATPTPSTQTRTVPAADWEAAAAAFQSVPAPAPAPAPAASLAESSPTLESVERRRLTPEPAPAVTDTLDSLTARLAATGLAPAGLAPAGLGAAGDVNGLDDVLDELEADTDPAGGAEEPSLPPLAVEPVSGEIDCTAGDATS